MRSKKPQLRPPRLVCTLAAFYKSSLLTFLMVLYFGIPTIFVRTSLGKDSMNNSRVAVVIVGMGGGYWWNAVCYFVSLELTMALKTRCSGEDVLN